MAASRPVSHSVIYTFVPTPAFGSMAVVLYMDGMCKIFVNPNLRVQNRRYYLDILHSVYFIDF